MKATCFNLFSKAVIGASVGFLPCAAFGQSSTLTYQGKLESAGDPANGLHDFQFLLFAAASGGTQLVPTVCVDSVNVVDGLFTVPIDFGAAVFDGSPRFMHIFVRSDTTAGNCATGTYSSLSPRQPITATPYALKVAGIDGNSLNAADGSPTDAVFVDSSGKVGIGTLAPVNTVHIATVGPTIALQDLAASSQQAGYVSYRDSGNVERAWVGFGSPGSPQFSVVNARPSGKIALQTFGGGGAVILPSDNLGIGTSTPGYPVHIFNDLNCVVTLQDSGPNATQSGYVSFRNGSGTETGWMGYGTPGSPHMSLINARAGGNIAITPLGGGVVQVPVLEITGADLAEKFPASEKLEPGMVVAIDAKNAGKLCLSRGAYNKCVAGVVSGANNFSVGAVLGSLPGHEDAPAIALSGRVYVQCDASQGAIEPGDMLTTSDTPGYAMKACDADRLTGAVIGKAMERLESGRGLVLVLVNLQ